MSKCYICPRECGADRSAGELGFCRESSEMRIARYSLHMWEEPSISGEHGSGTIFFCGCNLRCEFCQNMSISHTGEKGYTVSRERLSEIMLELCDMGAENINLVTPTHFADSIAEVLSTIKHRLKIPVVYNTSGYESVGTLKMFDGLVDIYIPDFKYFSNDLAKKYSSVGDYRELCEAAILEMHRQVCPCRFDENGKMLKGLIVRHLVLPNCRRDSISVLDRLAELLPKNDFYISLMSQYTPDFAKNAGSPHTELHRKLTTFEYTSVLKHAQELLLQGYCQDKSSSTADFTPSF